MAVEHARGYKTDRDDAVFERICLGYSASPLLGKD